jgi:hypothetical protein
MEQALRERSLSSASTRRQRIQEREELRQQAKKEARERVLALQDLSDCESRSGSDDENPGSNHSREDSYETSSEYSLNTPDHTPQAMYDKNSAFTDINKPALRVVVPETPVDGRQTDTAIDSEPAPKLQASLATFSDFHYDRFSMIVDSPAEILTSPVSDTDEQESLCEVATPVSYSMPRTRPAVVSIVSSKGSNKKRRTSSAASSLLQQATQRSATTPPELPARNANRLSQSSQRSGFLASEAAPFRVPELPSNAMYMIANASRDSLAISTHSAEPTTARPQSTRKHSMPLLSAAFKSSHSRMSSIKGLVSPSISNPRASTLSSNFQSRPRTAVAADSMSFETVPADLNEPLPPPRQYSHRPTTSYASSIRSGSVTALPTPPPQSEPRTLYHQQQTPVHTPREGAPSPEQNPRRKKSFSSLRKRSESISNAIKFVSGKSGSSNRDSRLPPTPNANVPPVPSIRDSRISQDLSTFPSPAPPVPSSRDQLRKSVTNANYSVFPSAAHHSGRGIIGLGIRT